MLSAWTHRAVYPAVLVLMCAGAASAQDQGAAANQKKLEGEYQLTKTTADKSDIVTAGSVVVLQKDNVLMLAATSTNPCRNTYKDGKITQSGPCRTNEKVKKFSRFTSMIPGAGSVPDAPASRTFVAGEKFWVTKIEVKVSGKEQGILLGFFTDAINDTRYATSLFIPFGAITPSPDEALKAVAEIITVAPSDDKNADDKGGDKGQAAPQGGQQEAPSQPAAAPAAPAPAEAPPPPIEAPPPPPPDTVSVSEGQTIDQVVAALGQPVKKAKVGTKDIYYYKDLKITFVNGKVTDVQ
ncbi:MAG: hypothetical protein WB579_17140 [Bryobacteraceae bacterium]